MHSSPRRIVACAGISGALIVAAAVLAGTANAAGAIDPAPIGANQFFTGLVNNTKDNPVVTTDCVGPVTPGEMGHPVANQTVTVDPASASSSSVDIGFTGSAGDSVEVFLGAANSGVASSAVVGTTTEYAVPLKIPTTIEVPCDGAGVAAFVPKPTSMTAKTATLAVTFESIGVTPGP